MKKIPKTLEHDPIIESIFEIRFVGNIPQVAELLPGMLPKSIREKYPKIENLTQPIPMLTGEDPGPQYRLTKRMVGDYSMLQIGEKTLSLACRKPYKGWEKFKEEIVCLLDALNEIGVIKSIERFSLKYINIIDASIGGPGLNGLELGMELGGYNLLENSSGFKLRTEIKIDNYVNILNIVPHVQAKILNETFKGLIIDIDTIFDNNLDNIDQVKENLDGCRSMEKIIFFRILKDDVINKFKPVWE